MGDKNELDQGKRALIKGGLALGAGFLFKNLLRGEVRADAPSWIKFDYSVVGVPEGRDGEIKPLSLITADTNVVVVTTGDFTYQDPTGAGVEYVGKGNNQDRASLIICEGPVGQVNGGADVSLMVRTKHNWVGVTAKPNGVQPLTGGEMQELIDERVSSLRDPKNKNGKDGGGLTGPVDVLIIDGRSGKIRETRVIYP